MIRQMDRLTESSVLHRCTGDVAGIKIQSLFRCYHPYPFIEFWIQHSDGEPNAVIAKLDEAITVCVLRMNDDDKAELVDFIRIVGCYTVFSTVPLLNEENIIAESGKIMKHSGVSRAPENPLSELNLENICRQPSLQDVYQILETCAGTSIALPSFPSWAADMSHRIRRGCARMWVADGKGAALVSFETGDSALLGGVAVLAEHRKSGIGSALVTALTETLRGEGKKVYLCRTKNENESFYTKLDFMNCGDWYNCTYR